MDIQCILLIIEMMNKLIVERHLNNNERSRFDNDRIRQSELIEPIKQKISEFKKYPQTFEENMPFSGYSIIDNNQNYYLILTDEIALMKYEEVSRIKYKDIEACIKEYIKHEFFNGYDNLEIIEDL